MSAITQFFPQPGSSGGGGGGNVGGGTTPVEIIGVSGGGGGGGNSSCPTCPQTPTTTGCGGQGGSGAIFYANNYFLTPGTTYPITIGTGGAAGTPSTSTADAPAGTNGGATIFCNPLCVLCVAGGGGGGGSNRSSNDCSPTSVSNGKKGGTGGGGGNWNKDGDINCPKCRGIPAPGMYYRTTLKYECNKCAYAIAKYGPTGSNQTFPVSEQLLVSSAEVLEMPWGWMGGFPASETSRCYQPGPNQYGSSGAPCGGGMMSNAATLRLDVVCACPGPATIVCPISTIVGVCSRYYELTWGTCTLSIGNPCGIYNNGPGGDGCVAEGGGPASGGGSGVLLIRYPDQEAAATVVGGTDISPETPGYRTYCFTSSGSITL